MIRAALDALLVDIGGTIVREAAPGTPVSDLTVIPLPHVEEDLAYLAAELPVMAVTNTSVMREKDVLGLLAQADLARHFVGAVTSAEIGVAKPDPAPVIAALTRLGEAGRRPGRVLFVGDLPTDEAAAEAAGVPYAAITDRGLLAAVTAWIESQAGRRFRAIATQVRPPSKPAGAAAESLHTRLTKPLGSLGKLESLGVRLAAMCGKCPPAAAEPAALAIFAADHGVVAEGVTPWPQEVTTQMVRNFAAGGAAANVLAAQAGVEITVVDVGLAGPDVSGGRVVNRRVRSGTQSLARSPAMTVTEAALALDVGVDVALDLVDNGARCLLTGEMGIGNTTATAALIGTLTGVPAAEVTGRGTGIDDARLALKTEIVRAASARAQGFGPLEVLAEVGGLEIAALAGFIVGGASRGVPVLLDGVITAAAAVVAESLVPTTVAWCVAGHLSTEPGARVALDHLALDPLLDLNLRLGEGSGALLAYPLLLAAAAVLRGMATFDSAGVTRADGSAEEV